MGGKVNTKRILIMSVAGMAGLLIAFVLVITVNYNQAKDLKNGDYDTLQQMYEENDSFQKSFDKNFGDDEDTKVQLEGNRIIITTNVGKMENTEENRAKQEKKAGKSISVKKVKKTIRGLESQVNIDGISVEYRYINRQKELLYSIVIDENGKVVA